MGAGSTEAIRHGAAVPMAGTESASVPGSVSARCYREHERARVVASLLANSSLLVVSGPGLGKSMLARFVAEELRTRGFPVALVSPTTGKQVLIEVAEQLGLGVSRLDGRVQSSVELQHAISDLLRARPAFLIFDDAHRLPASLRAWLETLLAEGHNMVLLATYPPRRDIFLKLPRLELQPLSRQPIREVMKAAAVELGVEVNPSQLAKLQERAGGNPMLAKRVIREEYLGLEDTSPDHSEWIDGTPLLVAGLMVCAVLRFIGRGLHSTDLYLLGGVMTVAVGIVRVLIMSLPKATNRIGQ